MTGVKSCSMNGWRIHRTKERSSADLPSTPVLVTCRFQKYPESITRFRHRKHQGPRILLGSARLVGIFPVSYRLRVRLRQLVCQLNLIDLPALVETTHSPKLGMAQNPSFSNLVSPLSISNSAPRYESFTRRASPERLPRYKTGSIVRPNKDPH